MNDRSSWYEERAEAAGEYASEVAHEMYSDGIFEDDIKSDILDGQFDEEVIKRIKDLVPIWVFEQIEKHRVKDEE